MTSIKLTATPDGPYRLDGQVTILHREGRSADRPFAAHGLIDEYRINVQPVALGDGLALLQGLPEPQPLELVASTAWADGPITQTYVPRPERTN